MNNRRIRLATYRRWFREPLVIVETGYYVPDIPGHAGGWHWREATPLEAMRQIKFAKEEDDD